MKTAFHAVVITLLVSLTLIIQSAPADAHSGRTDAYGGHNCYVGSCAGTYHYHNGGYVDDTPRYACKITYPSDSGSFMLPKYFNTHAEARKYWDDTTRGDAQEVYQLYLGRNPSEKEYLAVVRRFPYNNCRGNHDKWSEFSEEIKNSDERKTLLAKEQEERDRLAEEVRIAREVELKIRAEEATRVASEKREVAQRVGFSTLVIVAVFGALYFSTLKNS